MLTPQRNIQMRSWLKYNKRRPNPLIHFQNDVDLQVHDESRIIGHIRRM